MNLETLVLPLKTEDNAFRAGISRVIQLVGGAVDAFQGAIKATFQWADEMDSLQDVMGVTNKAAAALNFVLRKSGTETEILAKGMTILEKGLVDAKGKLDTTGKALAKWGINALDINGKLKDQEVLVGEVANKYSQFATQQEKVNFLTEIFGRSGAELVDFFDTLASDGGIDAVSAKVERLGLAIDPNRYEQFNRNLEELKLVGLGMAVSLTEKVMPALEGFIGMISDFAADPDVGKALGSIDNFVGKILKGLGDSVSDWVSGGGPEQLSDNLISWIENLGESDTAKSKALIGMQHLVGALGEAIGQIDWMGITDAIDSKLAESINNHDWHTSGDEFGKKLADFFTMGISTGMEGKSSEAIPAIGNAISNWLLGAMNMTKWSDVGSRIGAGLQAAMNNALPGVTSSGMSTGMQIITSITAGFLRSQPAFMAALSAFNQALESDKLRQIAKTFFNAAGRWVSQAAAGFMDHVSVIYNAVSTIVGEINKILNKIVTVFSLTIKPPTWMGGGSAPPTSHAPSGSTGSHSTGHRASHGPVIKGQPYDVAEFFRPEVFTPSTSGRVDGMKTSDVVTLSETSIDRLVEKLLLGLPSAMVKAMNNA